MKTRGLSAAGAQGEQTFNLSIRDENVRRADDCNDGAATTGVTDTRTVAAGTYFVGIKPQTSVTAGNYSIGVRDTGYATSGGNTVAGGCTSGSTIDVPVTANTDYYVMVKGEAAGAQGAFDLTLTDVGALTGSVTDIGCGDLAATDAYYQFTVAGAPYDAGNRKNVEVAFTNAFDGAFRVYRDVGADGSTANDTAEGAASARSARTRTACCPYYYVVAKGRSVAAVRPRCDAARDPRPRRGRLHRLRRRHERIAAMIDPDQPLPPAPTTSRQWPGRLARRLRAPVREPRRADGGSATQIDCTSPTDPTNAGILDVNLLPNTDYYVIVKGDGAADRGNYTLQVTDTTQIQAIDSACPADITAPDGYAAFNVTDGPRDILIDMTGSTLVGALQVFEADGDAIPGCGCTDTTTPLTCTLVDGSYYVLYRAIVGAGSLGTQPFELVLRDESNFGALECDDGLVAGGATIRRNLNAGTYYVGIATARTNLSTNYDYTLTVNDATIAAANAAVEIECGDNDADANVLPGHSYTRGQGKNDGDVGDYKLNVQDCQACRASAAATTSLRPTVYSSSRLRTPRVRASPSKRQARAADGRSAVPVRRQLHRQRTRQRHGPVLRHA